LFCQSKSKSKIKKKNNALINEKKSYLNCRVPSPSRGGEKKGGREERFVVSVRACATRPAYQPAQACPEPACISNSAIADHKQIQAKPASQNGRMAELRRNWVFIILLLNPFSWCYTERKDLFLFRVLI
jgi:hypothetical protein